MQYIAVWYKSPNGIGPKLPTTFTKSLTDKGFICDLTSGVDLGTIKKDSLGIVLMEDNDVVASTTWRESSVDIIPAEGNTVKILNPKGED
jgi:hypothetical protein